MYPFTTPPRRSQRLFMAILVPVLLTFFVLSLLRAADAPAPGPATRPTVVPASVVFVCDASGSMLQAGKMGLLRTELMKAIDSLTPEQRFNVVLFQGKTSQAVNPFALMPGTDENKRKSEAFLARVQPNGMTNPLPALETALRMNPEWLFFLTDGDFENPNNEAVIAWVRAHNLRKIRVNTVAFVERGESYEKVLKTIASDSGGTYKYFNGAPPAERPRVWGNPAGDAPAAVSACFNLQPAPAPGAAAPAPGDASGPRAEFMHSAVSAASVVYVCDASGSMIGQQFDILKEELKRSIDQLSDSQSFDIVFFQDNTFRSLSGAMKSPGLVKATASRKRATADFLRSVGTGPDSNPLPALEQALKLHPEAVYLLTDGAFEDGPAVLLALAGWNAGKKTRIHTIAFLRPDMTRMEVKECEEMLKKIADDNNGTFQKVMTSEFHKK